MMRKLILTFCAFALATGVAFLPSQLRAETKPIAAVAVKSYDELLSDVKFVGNLADKPDLSALVEGLVALGTQGKGMAGIDKSRPWGAVIQANDEEITGYAFLPVSDSKAFMGLLSLYTTVEKQGGAYKFTPKDGKQEFYGKRHGKWVVFSNEAATLDTAAEEPTALLKGANDQNLITGRVFLANVPEKYQQMLIGKIEDGAREDLEKKEDEPEELHTARKKTSAKVVAAMKEAIQCMDQITLGMGLDRSAEKMYSEVSLTAKAGTPLADQMDSLEKSVTKLAGVKLAGAALNAVIAAPITESKASILESIISLGRKQAISDSEKKDPPEKQETAKVVINNVADMLQKMVKSGRFDMAASVNMTPNAPVAVAAAFIADGDLLDKTLHTIDETIEKENPAIAQIVKLNAETVDSVKLHTITIPIGPETKDRDKVVRMFGDAIHVVVGVGSDTAYIAAGRDAMEAIKKAITSGASAGGKSVPPVDVSVDAQKVAAFMVVNGEKKDRAKMKEVAEELKKSPDKDSITWVAKSIPQGVQYRLEIQQGLLRTAGKMIGEGKK